MSQQFLAYRDFSCRRRLVFLLDDDNAQSSKFLLDGCRLAVQLFRQDFRVGCACFPELD
jgi:hypothetical protein